MGCQQAMLAFSTSVGLLLFIVQPSNCFFDPLSVAAGGAAIIGGAVVGGFTFFRCRFSECCNSRWVNTNMSGLAGRLESKLYGQHLVVTTVTKHISAHMRNPDPPKAMALSFHGWTGTGKNYASQIIAQHIFKNGVKSKYVHLISATREFPHEDRLQLYKDRLKGWIEGNITKCERSMFIFDEMDKLPDGLLDVIKPYLEYYEAIGGVTYRKAIFIFLSNTAGSDISRLTLDYWMHARSREDITLKEMEQVIAKTTINTPKGLWHSELITKNLITAFIPFLPLERTHVKECIIDVLLAKKYIRHRTDAEMQTNTSEIINSIADELTFYPKEEQLYSTTGCKRVAEKLDFVMEDA